MRHQDNEKLSGLTEEQKQALGVLEKAVEAAIESYAEDMRKFIKGSWFPYPEDDIEDGGRNASERVERAIQTYYDLHESFRKTNRKKGQQ